MPPEDSQPTANNPTTPPAPSVSPSSDVPTTPKPAEVSPTSSTVPSPKPKSSHMLMWVVLVVVVVLIAGGALTYAVMHKNNKKPVVSTAKNVSLLTYINSNNPFNVDYPSDAVIKGPLGIYDQMFEGLVQFTDGTKIVPDLAASWTNPNSNTWIFTLKPNVYYHDGDTVTAQDVVYSWQQVVANTKQLASYTTNTIKNVQALSSSTVEITTTTPDPVLLNRLTNLWVIDSKAPTGTPNWELGTGAYTVKSGTTPTADNIDLVAFNKWHGGSSNIHTNEVDVDFQASNTEAVSQLISDVGAGKTAMTNPDLPKSQIEQELKSNPNLEVINVPTTYVDFLGFDTTNASYPTANPKIREAIDLTLNPATILSAYGIFGTTIDQVIPPEVPGYNPNVVRPAINLTEAKQLVQEAGYPNGVTIQLGIGEPALAVGQEMAKELAPIGITLQLEEATDEGTFFNNINTGAYQSFYEAAGTNITDASDALTSWSGVAYYNNPTFTAELNKADTTLDPTTRLAELQEATQTLLTDNAYIPLYQHQLAILASKGLSLPFGLFNNDTDAYYSTIYQN